MSSKLEQRIADIKSCKQKALSIIDGLKVDDVKKKLKLIRMIEDFPDFSGDDEIKERSDYHELKKLLKTLYIEIARTIMAILDVGEDYVVNRQSSFTHSEPVDAMEAAECIKLLPNAYIGGPMKSAISNPHLKVKKIAVDYYGSIPADVKFSGVFPTDFSKVVMELKTKLKGQL